VFFRDGGVFVRGGGVFFRDGGVFVRGGVGHDLEEYGLCGSGLFVFEGVLVREGVFVLDGVLSQIRFEKGSSNSSSLHALIF
jgi:hypothetical protein